MYKVFLHIVFFFCLLQGNAQTNLIYNGDFELYDTCPTSISTPGDYQIERCLGWTSPTRGTSDYFNTCAAWPVSIPYNTMGNQSAFSGNGYCGILLENQQPPFVWTGFWFEYLQGRLIMPLEEFQEYEFSCRIVMSKILHEYSYSKFGAFFSSDTIRRTDAKPFDLTPQAINPYHNFLADTTYWMKISCRFFANGGERYVTLGFFSDTSNLDTLRNTTLVIDPNHFASYYYIDNCSLINTGNTYSPANIFSPNGDNKNDYWIPDFFHDGDKIKIFNRWGEEVFQITNKDNPWRGESINGRTNSDGIYYYVFLNKKEKGFIQLVR